MANNFADFLTALREKKLHLRNGDGLHVTADIVAAIIADLPEALHSVDACERVVAANDSALRLYGYTHEELCGMSFYDLYVDREETQRGFTKLLEQGHIDVFTKIKTKDERFIDIRMKSFALFDADKKFVQTLSILRDVSELRQLKHELLQASRFSEMGKFAAGIVHDIRSPLTVIKGFTDCVLDSASCQQDAQVMSAAASVQRAVAKVERFTTRLLQVRVAGAEEEVHDVDVVMVINEVLEMLDTKIREVGVTVARELPQECCLQGRKQQLEQVVSNIISNACDAVSDVDERQLLIHVEQEDTHVRLSFADTGVGIAENLRARIFDAFFTTKHSTQGTGIGLTIASEIVSAHQGRIDISSNQPQGTVFTVSLPTTQAAQKVR